MFSDILKKMEIVAVSKEDKKYFTAVKKLYERDEALEDKQDEWKDKNPLLQKPNKEQDPKIYDMIKDIIKTLDEIKLYLIQHIENITDQMIEDNKITDYLFENMLEKIEYYMNTYDDCLDQQNDFFQKMISSH